MDNKPHTICGFLTVIWVTFCKVARVAWWMGAYAAPTPKRHYAFSNSRAILKLDLGVLKWKKIKATRDPRLRVETVKVYKDGKGKVRYQGTKSLRSTELLVDHISLFSLKQITIN